MAQPQPQTESPTEYDTGAFGTVKIVKRDCPCCGRDNADRPASRYSSGIWQIRTCADCGFVYIDKSPDYAALFADMAWERTTKVEEDRRAKIRPISYRASKWTRIRLHILPRLQMPALVAKHAKPGNVIDLGCGSGGQLAGLTEDYVPFGVEISSELAAEASAFFASRGGRAVNAPSIDGLREYADGFFTAATLRSYLEHELNPAGVLRALHPTLAPGGVAIVKIPNYGCVNRMVMGRRWCGFRYPDHLNYFTPKSLTRMAADCGYRVSWGPTFKLPTSDNMYALLWKI